MLWRNVKEDRELPGQWRGRAGQDCAESLIRRPFIFSNKAPRSLRRAGGDIGHFVVCHYNDQNICLCFSCSNFSTVKRVSLSHNILFYVQRATLAQVNQVLRSGSI